MPPARHTWPLMATACLSLLAGCASGTPPVPVSTAPAVTGSSTPSVLADGKILVGSKNDQPGTAYAPGNKGRVGLDYSVMDSIVSTLHVSPTYTYVTSFDRDSKIRNRDVEALIATYSNTKERRRFAMFAGPYLSTKQGFLVREGDTRIKELKDLKDKVICTARGSTSSVVGKETDKPLQLETDFSTCVDRLLAPAKSVDVVFTDLAILYGFLKRDPDKLMLIPGLEYGNLNHYGIALSRANRDDCLKIRDALAAYMRDRWTIDMRANLPLLTVGDWELVYRPREGKLMADSCR